MAVNPQEFENRSLTQGKNFLLVIAINAYLHLSPLRNAVLDAKRLMAVLTEKYTFDMENVYALYDSDATRDTIYKALDELSSRIDADDNLLMVYIGHGNTDPSGDRGYWVPVDAEIEKRSTLIPLDEITRFMETSKAKHIAIIADAAFQESLLIEPRRRSREPGFKQRSDPTIDYQQKRRPKTQK